MMKMYFDPDSFERISKSIKQNPCPFRPYSLALVDSFALYMLLQLHIKGGAFAEQKTTLDALRPAIAKSDDRRKNKDIIYLFHVLQGANMITFNMTRKTDVCFRLVEYTPTKLSTQGKPRSLVAIKKCNRHVLEDYPSTVPFAIYCLLCSLMRRDDGIISKVKISFDRITRLLHISPATLARYKDALEEAGYIWTIKGKLYESKETQTGLKREVNQYVIYDHNHHRHKEKNEAFRLRKQEWESQKLI